LIGQILPKILRFFLLTILALIIYSAKSQKLNNVWTFGDHLGLDFNTTPASVIYSEATVIGSPYFLSSICNAKGELLFYTDGHKVWTARNIPMEKIRHPWPWAGFVMPLICPDPGNDSLHYLFGVSERGNANCLQYVTVNLKAKGGEGEIVYPPAPEDYYTNLQSNTSLLIAGTAHCNGKDKWIISHTPGSLNAHKVTSTGVDNVPVVSQIPGSILPLSLLQGGLSNFKFSANGERMIVPLINEQKIAVFDFNNQTGKFTNAMKLNIPADQYLEDIELSPDGSRLYFASYTAQTEEPWAELHYLYQMDLDAVTPSAIEQTLFQLTDVPDRAVCVRMCIVIHRTMQLSPDGKIYITMKDYDRVDLDLTVSVIENPNNKGINALYRKNHVNLKKRCKAIKYNYIRSNSFSLKENGIQVQQKVCADQPAKFSLLFNKVDSVKWDFGDQESEERNFSTLFEPEHTYPAPGIYNARAIIYTKCYSDTAKKIVTIQNIPSVHVPGLIKDTILCLGTELTLDATLPNATSYLWENGLILPQRKIDKGGTYRIMVSNECSAESHTFNVGYKECECKTFIPNSFTPNNDYLNDVFKPIVECLAQNYKFQIFDRFGKVIFNSTNKQDGWDGKIKNMAAAPGIYIWLLEYRNPNNREMIRKKGTVLVLH
jgi:gliding motility-associated-like protein